MYLDTRDLQEQIDNLELEIESVEEYIEEAEAELEDLGEELIETEEETGTPQPEPPEIDEIESAKESLQDLREELQPLLDLKYEGIPEWDDGATLIPESDWEEYVEDLLKDCGYISNDVPWWIVIDWAATADNVAADYSTVDYDGDTYYYMDC